MNIVWERRARMRMPPSSRGQGHLSFKEAAGIRIPLGVGYYERKEVDRGFSISFELILPGSMPEWLMGTDCKFVGNMSTLVQIQLGPRIRGSTRQWYRPFVLHNALQKFRLHKIIKKVKLHISLSLYLIRYISLLTKMLIFLTLWFHIRMSKDKIKSK